MRSGLIHSLVISPERGSEGKATSRQRQGDLEAEPPALGNFWDLLPK